MTKRIDIPAAAQRVLAQASITEAPVNVDAIAAKLGAVISYEPYAEDLSGVLVKEKLRIVIGVNSAHPRNRQRFTVAHELGHLVLAHQGEMFVDKTMKSQAMVMKRDVASSRAVDQQEIQANRFAAELLMPGIFIANSIRRRFDKRTKIEQAQLVAELAEEYQVSSQAMEYRLTNLGILMPH